MNDAKGCCGHGGDLPSGEELHCPVEATLGMIGGKYKTLILWKLISGPMRFSELRRTVPGATPKMLTQQLRELEKDGLVHREIFPVIPPRVEYSLTERGEALIPTLDALSKWGEEQMRLDGARRSV